MYSIDDYDYELPPQLIAQYPADKRSHSRLLVLRGNEIVDRNFTDLPAFLEPGDLLVVNNTKVVPARLFAVKPTGGQVELLILKELAPGRVRAMFRTKRGLKQGLELTFLTRSGEPTNVMARVVERFIDGTVELEHPFESWNELLDRFGHVALPPYIRRSDREEDFLRYQTVYARHQGAVAAPTAGLHFDRALLDVLAQKGVGMATVTLHVGPGTFKPIRVQDIREHNVDPEWVEVSRETVDRIQKTRQNGGRVIAVGTTTVRSLESAAKFGNLGPYSGPTDLYILPGHDFKVVDGLVTNFHLPKSSLMVLVSAFAGLDRIKKAYSHAVQQGYRFFSYGDAMLILKG